MQRVSMLQELLKNNIEDQDINGRLVYLHVCNNGDSAQEAKITDILTTIKGLAGYRLRTFRNNPGGFARFHMMRDALHEFNVDHFVMMYDDIMLPTNRGLSDLVAHARQFLVGPILQVEVRLLFLQAVPKRS